MAEIIRLRGSPHDEVQRLLPWFVNGTLVAEEAELVQAHIAECAECRADAEGERQMARELASMPLDVESSWAGIEQQLKGDRTNVVERHAGFWRKRIPVGWAVASPLAAAAAVALLFVNVTPRQPVGDQYRALGSATLVQSANVVVVFEADTPEKALRDALAAADARIVDGPTETGAYLLRVDQTKREQALKTLRDSNAIALAEPIDGPAHQ
jgi:anti-sigma-K factor RskA